MKAIANFITIYVSELYLFFPFLFFSNFGHCVIFFLVFPCLCLTKRFLSVTNAGLKSYLSFFLLLLHQCLSQSHLLLCNLNCFIPFTLFFCFSCISHSHQNSRKPHLGLLPLWRSWNFWCGFY